MYYICNSVKIDGNKKWNIFKRLFIFKYSKLGIIEHATISETESQD